MTEHVYLVGTHAGLYRIRLTTTLELIECTQLFRGHHYAISLRADEGRVYSKHQDTYLNVLAIDTLDKIDEVAFSTSPGQVHQALVTDAGLLFTDTQHNTISNQSHDGELVHYVIDGYTHDVNHVNSLFLRDGGVVAMLHNLGNGPSELLDLDFDPQIGFAVRQRRAVSDTGCHNVFIDGDLCMFNASNVGAFVVHDLTSAIDIERLEFGGHTKGLSVTDEHIIIGVSEVATQAERGACDSALAFLERSDRSLIKVVPLRTTDGGAKIGNLNEVRCLSRPDYSEGSPTQGRVAFPAALPLRKRVVSAIRGLGSNLFRAKAN